MTIEFMEQNKSQRCFKDCRCRKKSHANCGGGCSHAVAAESSSMLSRAKSSDISRVDEGDAIENRLSKANALLDEDQKTANAAPGDKAEQIAKMSGELQRSIKNMIESVMHELKSFFSASSGKHT